MDDAAGPGADALFPRFVCRVSGAPADTVDELRATRSLALLAELRQVEQRVHGAREDVSQRLFAAIGAAQEPPAPITIYRALDFLRENGLVHRIESRNAFIACVHNHETGTPVVFLICERCGAVGEAPSQAAAEPLMAAAREAAFVPKVPVIEIGGICRHCRAD